MLLHVYPYSEQLPYQTFVTKDRHIRIYDNNFKEFYFYDVPAYREKQIFNLPKGIYHTNNRLKPLKKPLVYPSLPLLPPDKKYPVPITNIVFKLGNTGQKGFISISPEKGIAQIVLDKEILYKYPRYVTDFILGHELGHIKYKYEDLCDRFSNVLLLKMGYNPSQINKAIAYTLNNKTFEGRHRNFNRFNDNYLISYNTYYK